MRNVASLVRIPLPRTNRPIIWSVDQARRFLESAHEDSDPFLAGYVLLLVLGLRRGEMLGLAWQDVDFALAEARIAFQLQRVGGHLVRRKTKTASSEAPSHSPRSVSALSRIVGNSSDGGAQPRRMPGRRTTS